MLKNVLSISGRPVIFLLVTGAIILIMVVGVATGTRTPAYAHDKVISLADVSIYTVEGDTPLAGVLESVKEKTGAQPVDVKALGSDEKVREYFATILPDFDADRVYTTDIKKLFAWYNLLLEAGITDFADKEEEASETEEGK